MTSKNLEHNGKDSPVFNLPPVAPIWWHRRTHSLVELPADLKFREFFDLYGMDRDSVNELIRLCHAPVGWETFEN